MPIFHVKAPPTPLWKKIRNIGSVPKNIKKATDVRVSVILPRGLSQTGNDSECTQQQIWRGFETDPFDAKFVFPSTTMTEDNLTKDIGKFANVRVEISFMAVDAMGHISHQFIGDASFLISEFFQEEAQSCISDTSFFRAGVQTPFVMSSLTAADLPESAMALSLQVQTDAFKTISNDLSSVDREMDATLREHDCTWGTCTKSMMRGQLGNSQFASVCAQEVGMDDAFLLNHVTAAATMIMPRSSDLRSEGETPLQMVNNTVHQMVYPGPHAPVWTDTTSTDRFLLRQQAVADVILRTLNQTQNRKYGADEGAMVDSDGHISWISDEIQNHIAVDDIGDCEDSAEVIIAAANTMTKPPPDGAKETFDLEWLTDRDPTASEVRSIMRHFLGRTELGLGLGIATTMSAGDVKNAQIASSSPEHPELKLDAMSALSVYTAADSAAERKLTDEEIKGLAEHRANAMHALTIGKILPITASRDLTNKNHRKYTTDEVFSPENGFSGHCFAIFMHRAPQYAQKTDDRPRQFFKASAKKTSIDPKLSSMIHTIHPSLFSDAAHEHARQEATEAGAVRNLVARACTPDGTGFMSNFPNGSQTNGAIILQDLMDGIYAKAQKIVDAMAPTSTNFKTEESFHAAKTFHDTTTIPLIDHICGNLTAMIPSVVRTDGGCALERIGSTSQNFKKWEFTTLITQFIAKCPDTGFYSPSLPITGDYKVGVTPGELAFGKYPIQTLMIATEAIKKSQETSKVTDPILSSAGVTHSGMAIDPTTSQVHPVLISSAQKFEIAKLKAFLEFGKKKTHERDLARSPNPAVSILVPSIDLFSRTMKDQFHNFGMESIQTLCRGTEDPEEFNVADFMGPFVVFGVNDSPCRVYIGIERI